jgi:ribonuclease R
MLPTRLSNGICSLNAGEDRLALTVFMEINDEGNVIRYEVGPAVIRVNERMTYTSVRRILEDNDPELGQRYADFVLTLQKMRDLCLILRRRRRIRGALDFDFPESKVKLDEEGRPVDVLLMERSVAEQLIEEFMLIANESIECMRSLNPTNWNLLMNFCMVLVFISRQGRACTRASFRRSCTRWRGALSN